MRSASVASAFTIVELLIVIVVIAILAAITIVSYNGITNNAKISAVESLASQANKKLLTWSVQNNETFPANKTAFLAATGLVDPDGVTYQYNANTTMTPYTYCLTITQNSLSYYINNTTNTTPVTGSCPVVTNLASNPSLEFDTSNWGTYTPTGAVAVSRLTSGGAAGSAFYRLTWTSATTSPAGGCYALPVATNLITVGDTYAASMYVRSSKSQQLRIQLEWYNSTGRIGTVVYGPTVTVAAGAWTRLSVIGPTAPSGTSKLAIAAYADPTGMNWQVNDYLDCDAVMATDGPKLYTYADGDSAGWAWGGTAESSVSTGPGL